MKDCLLDSLNMNSLTLNCQRKQCKDMAQRTPSSKQLFVQHCIKLWWKSKSEQFQHLGETAIYGKNKRSQSGEKQMCGGQKMSPGVRREQRKKGQGGCDREKNAKEKKRKEVLKQFIRGRVWRQENMNYQSQIRCRSTFFHQLLFDATKQQEEIQLLSHAQR